MMTNTLRLILCIGILIYFSIVIRLLQKKVLKLKYSLLWILMGIVMVFLTMFPQILGLLSNALGIYDEMNALFTTLIGFLFVLVMALTSIVSKQSNKIKELVQVSALLEKRIRELEKVKLG